MNILPERVDFMDDSFIQYINMKQYLIIILFFIISQFAAYGQNCQGVIIGNQLSFFKNSEDCFGATVISLQNITNEENFLLRDSTSNAYLIADIIKYSNDRFLVNIMSSDTDAFPFEMDSIWISTKNVGIGITTSNVNGKPGIPLYARPSYDSKHAMLPNDAAYIITEVSEFKERWLKIRYNDKDNVLTGWLAPENQCINMYSMCCGN